MRKSKTHQLHPIAPQSSSRLRLGDGTVDLGTALSRAQACRVAGERVGSLLDDLLALREDQLDVAGVGHIGVDLAAN